MNDVSVSDSKVSAKSGGPRSDRVEVVKVLALAIVSFLGGFGLVFLFLAPPSGDGPDLHDPTGESPPTGTSPAAGRFAPSAREDDGAGEDASVAAVDPAPARAEGDAPPEVPPGKTPDGLTLDGGAFVLKCWSNDGVEIAGEGCDRLELLEKRFSTRLYVIDECRIKAAGGSASGKLSVAAEVDFQKMAVSFWNGASSDIREATAIGSCLRDRLAGLPLGGIEHKHARYRLFFTVLFGDAAEKKQQAEAAKAAAFVAGKGKLVNVVKDRVRVRKVPVDGEILGRIGTGTQVRLLERKEGWCHVITPNRNEGWMTCDALEL
jgi:hypothetical protein